MYPLHLVERSSAGLALVKAVGGDAGLLPQNPSYDEMTEFWDFVVAEAFGKHRTAVTNWITAENCIILKATVAIAKLRFYTVPLRAQGVKPKQDIASLVAQNASGQPDNPTNEDPLIFVDAMQGGSWYGIQVGGERVMDAIEDGKAAVEVWTMIMQGKDLHGYWIPTSRFIEEVTTARTRPWLTPLCWLNLLKYFLLSAAARESYEQNLLRPKLAPAYLSWPLVHPKKW